MSWVRNLFFKRRKTPPGIYFAGQRLDGYSHVINPKTEIMLPAPKGENVHRTTLETMPRMDHHGGITPEIFITNDLPSLLEHADYINTESPNVPDNNRSPGRV